MERDVYMYLQGIISDSHNPLYRVWREAGFFYTYFLLSLSQYPFNANKKKKKENYLSVLETENLLFSCYSVSKNQIIMVTNLFDYISDTMNLYLIDTVTGAVIESVSHKKVSGPLHIVHSENWVVYTFFNDKYRRFEVSLLHHINYLYAFLHIVRT